MTGPVDFPEMVERANRARMENLRGKPLADHEYRAMRSQVEVDALTAALEAVAPLIAEQALGDAAAVLRDFYSEYKASEVLGELVADARTQISARKEQR